MKKNIVITDKSGGLTCTPASLDVKVGDTVVWIYDEPNQFYLSISNSTTTYQSEGVNGQQSLTLSIVPGFSFPASYNVGLVGQSSSSSSGGVITCSTCPHG